MTFSYFVHWWPFIVVFTRSVVMSLQLLPKLFSSLQQYVNNSYGPHWVTNWTVSELDVMGLFFKNLVLYMNNVAEAGTPPPCALYSHREEVKARLQFLSSIYSSELSKPDFGRFCTLSLFVPHHHLHLVLYILSNMQYHDYNHQIISLVLSW